MHGRILTFFILLAVLVNVAVSLPSKAAGEEMIRSIPAWGSISQNETSTDYQNISRIKVIAASLAFPGWGQKLTGHTGRAEAFLGAELGIWTAFTVFQIKGHLRRDSYINFAESIAGVQNADNRSEDYYRNVGRYMSTEDYMRDVQRDARARYLDDLEARRAYVGAHSIPLDQRWQWESHSDRHRYRDKRSSSMSAYQRRTYMVAISIVNRLFSAIDAARSYRSSSSSRGMSFHLQPDPDGVGPIQFCVSFPIP